MQQAMKNYYLGVVQIVLFWPTLVSALNSAKR
jgi:hypothetical protein